jgi:long-subunit acyl-CoA synthetase (AMP-forming)
MPIVTAYDTLGEEGLTHSLQETRAIAIFLDGHLIKSIVKPLSKAKDIKVRYPLVRTNSLVYYLQGRCSRARRRSVEERS